MTPEQKTIQDLRRDLLFVMQHPLDRCKVCRYRDRDCSKEGGCIPSWRGDSPEISDYGKKKRE